MSGRSATGAESAPPQFIMFADLRIRRAVEHRLLSVRLLGAAGARLYLATTIAKAVIRLLNSVRAYVTVWGRGSILPVAL